MTSKKMSPRQLWNKRYRESEKGRAARARYRNSEKGKRTEKLYNASDRAKEVKDSYEKTDKAKATRKAYYDSGGRAESNKRYVNTPHGRANINARARLSKRGLPTNRKDIKEWLEKGWLSEEDLIRATM